MNDRNLWVLVLVGLFLYFKSKRRRAGATMQPQPTPPKVTPPPTVKPGGWIAYRETLAQKESGKNYEARRPNSQYWGRYQLGRLARGATSARGVRWSAFKKNEALQDQAVREWTTRNLRELKAQPDAAKAVRDGRATWAQLVAMDHLTGRAATMRFVRTGASTADANNTKNTDWGRDFASFDINELTKGST
jgi:hypothetical protein